MTFMKKLSIGNKSVKEAFGLAWREKSFFWYPVAGVIVILVAEFVRRLLFGLLNIHCSFYEPAKEMSFGLLSCQLASLFLFTFIIYIFFTALIKRLFSRSLSFGDSFLILRDSIQTLFGLTLIITAIQVARIYWPFKKGLSIDYNVIGGGFKAAVDYGQLGLWLVSFVLLSAWAVGIYFFIPILIKKKGSLFQTLKASFLLAYRNFIVILWIWFLLIIYAILIFLVIGGVCFGIGWLFFSVLPIPLDATFRFLLTSIAIVPGVLSCIYLITAAALIPGILYLNFSKSR